MRKFYFYIVIIIILISLIIIGKDNHGQTSSLREDKRNFSIADTTLITQITLENRSLEKIKLFRNHKECVLNDALKANKYLINLLLKTVKEMRVKRPVSRAALPNIIKRMAIQNIKVIFHLWKLVI